jgi:hypothetical protein
MLEVRDTAHVHQHRAITVQAAHLSFGFGQSNTHRDLRGVPLIVYALRTGRKVVCPIFEPSSNLRWQRPLKAIKPTPDNACKKNR